MSKRETDKFIVLFEKDGEKIREEFTDYKKAAKRFYELEDKNIKPIFMLRKAENDLFINKFDGKATDMMRYKEFLDECEVN